MGSHHRQGAPPEGSRLQRGRLVTVTLARDEFRRCSLCIPYVDPLIPSKAVKDKAIRKRRFEDAGAAEMQDNARKRGL